MYLPRSVYESLPYGYGAVGACLVAASYARPAAAWADAALVLGIALVLAGVVLVLRRFTYREDASRYDRRALDEAEG
jgi:uncharacterized membrane protein HdeD (DUF308 family)